VSYVSTRRRRGMGQSILSALTYNPFSPGTYNSAGQYQGGNPFMDFYCGTIFGASDPTCAVPTPAQIAASQAAELAATSASPEAQAAAIAAGNVAVAQDIAANPANYMQQCAAALYPQLSATLGPGNVATLFGIDPTTCSQNLLSSGLFWIVVVGLAGIWFFAGKK